MLMKISMHINEWPSFSHRAEGHSPGKEKARTLSGFQIFRRSLAYCQGLSISLNTGDIVPGALRY
jgi:hypothetical protein